MRLRMDNIALRLISLGLALALWFAVAAEKSAEAPIEAPVEFQNVPEKLQVVGDVPHRVEVWVRGSPGLVQRLRPGDVYARVDLADARPGPQTVFIGAKDLKVPYAVSVVSISPSSFSFALEPTLQKRLTVKARLEGHPANGFRVGAVKCEPEVVVVTGPESRLKPLDGLSTLPVMVEQAQMTLVREVGLDMPDALVRMVDPRLIRVTADVEPSR